MFSQPGYGASEDEEFVSELEGVNSAQALWTRSRSDVEDEEYKEFYKHVSHDFEDPLSWSPQSGGRQVRVHKPDLFAQTRTV